LIGERGQAFLTTHSPAILQALSIDEISRLAAGANPVGLGGQQIGRVLKEAPDSLLSRLPVLCEGATETGLLTPVLNRFAADEGLPDIDALGIRLIGRNGQPTILQEAEEFIGAGLACGLFVDDETNHSGRRAALAEQPRCAFATWNGVRNIEEAVAKWLPWDQIPAVLDLGARVAERPVEDLLRQVGDCIGKPGTDSLNDLRATFNEARVREAVACAMQSKNSPWFKTVERGIALGDLMLQLGLPAEIEQVLRDFWRRVRQEAGWT
jgi:putative ATP-dependent endonuclease of OLD family